MISYNIGHNTIIFSIKDGKLEKVREKIKEGYDRKTLVEILKNFDTAGTTVFDGGRNRIKSFRVLHKNKEKEINVKLFKKKSPFMRLIYKYLKKSKAERSYLYGERLTKLGIKTPEPIAYFDEFHDEGTGEQRSFYISEELKYEFTGRELFWDEGDKPMKEKMSCERDTLIRLFTEFTFDMHEKGVEFEDFSPGNILIKKENSGKYGFYIIDLNRMKFHSKLSFNRRMKNVSRMMEYRKYVEKFSQEYADLYKKEYAEVFNRLYYYVKRHMLYVYIKDSTRTFRNYFKFNK